MPIFHFKKIDDFWAVQARRGFKSPTVPVNYFFSATLRLTFLVFIKNTEVVYSFFCICLIAFAVLFSMTSSTYL